MRGHSLRGRSVSAATNDMAIAEGEITRPRRRAGSCIIYNMNDSRTPRLRPAGPILVTRVRPRTVVQTAIVTVLFADLRGYTGMAESLPAVQVVPLLDEFCRVMAGGPPAPDAAAHPTAEADATR